MGNLEQFIKFAREEANKIRLLKQEIGYLLATLMIEKNRNDCANSPETLEKLFQFIDERAVKINDLL